MKTIRIESLQGKELSQVGPYLTLHFKNLLKIDQRPNTTKLSEGNIGVNLHDHGFGNGFSVMSPKAQTQKKWIDFMKIENFCTAKETIKVKRQLTIREKILANYI